MKKLVDESLNEFYGDNYVSTASNDVTREIPEGYMPPEEFGAFIDTLLDLDRDEAIKKLQDFMTGDNQYIHTELGEIEGKDLYKAEINKFIEKFDDGTWMA